MEESEVIRAGANADVPIDLDSNVPSRRQPSNQGREQSQTSAEPEMRARREEDRRRRDTEPSNREHVSGAPTTNSAGSNQLLRDSPGERDSSTVRAGSAFMDEERQLEARFQRDLQTAMERSMEDQGGSDSPHSLRPSSQPPARSTPRPSASASNTSTTTAPSTPPIGSFDAGVCVICFDEKRDVVFKPCGHIVTCHSCAGQLRSSGRPFCKRCPICKREIDEFFKIFVA